MLKLIFAAFSHPFAQSVVILLLGLLLLITPAALARFEIFPEQTILFFIRFGGVALFVMGLISIIFKDFPRALMHFSAHKTTKSPADTRQSDSDDCR
jgi:hypothetical protein